MTPLIKAIVARFQASSTLDDMAGSPWMDEPSDEADYPYCVFSVIPPGVHQPYYDGTYDDETVVRFTIVGENNTTTGLTDLAAFQTALHTQFDKHKLVLTSGSCYHALREGQSIRTAGIGKRGIRVGRADSIYRFKVTKSY